MEVFITHKTALQYWRTRSKTLAIPEQRQRGRKPPATPPKASVLLNSKIFGLSSPFEVTVCSENSKRTSSLFKSHFFPEVLPDRCLVDLGGGLLVASPELCFFQMASELPLIKLIELGYELCGSYTYALKTNVIEDESAEANRQADYNYNLITNKKRLAAFVAQMPGKHGKKNATRALQHIIDGSGSPMETILAMLLILPHNLGGYGLPQPEMNRRIDPKAAIKNDSSKQFYKCDLLWKDFNVAAEYDSNSHHSDGVNIADDSIKRGDLALSGIDVITVTSKQIYSAKECDKIARRVASKIGKRLQIKNPKFNLVCLELRNQLL